MGHGAHLKELIAQLLDVLPEPFDILALIAEQVALVANDDLRALGKLWAVLAQLRVYRVKVSTGSRPSLPETSTRCTSRRQRSMCRRKS